MTHTERSNWPNDATVAVSLTFDVDGETGFLGEGPTYARRLTSLSEGAFGIRRGIPRILELLSQHSIKATFFVPGHTAHLHPALVPALLDDGHEIGHHGHMHLRTDQINEAEQRSEIELGLKALEQAGAPRPTGYRSPAWEMTNDTFSLLAEHGFAYDSSCMADDRPYIQHWNGGSILELPVHWSLDDWPRFGWSIDAGGNLIHPAEVIETWIDEYREARDEGRHVVITMHPEVIGRAHRFKYLRAFVELMCQDQDVWFARLDEVAAHVRPSVTADAGPA